MKLSRNYKVVRSAALAVVAAGVVCLVAPSISHATDGTWINLAGGSWGTAGNWAGDVIAGGTDAIADFSTLNITADATVTLDGARTVGTLRFGDTTPSNRWNITTGTLTLASSSGPAVIETTTATGLYLDVALAGSSDVRFSGVAGTDIRFGKANTYTGKTIVSGGTIINLSGSGTFGANPASAVPDKITLDNGGFGIFSLTGSVAGRTIGANYGITLGPGGGFADVTGSAGRSEVLTLQSRVTGGGALRKAGNVHLLLNGLNDYSGGTTLSGNGAILLGNSSGLGSGTLTLSAGQGTIAPSAATPLVLANDLLFTTTESITFGQRPYGSGSTMIGGTGSLTFNGDIDYGTGNRQIQVTNDTTFNGDSTHASGTFTKSGAGKLTIGGSASHGGAATISEGTLVINGSLGSTTVSISSGATVGGFGSLGGSLTLNAGSFLDLSTATDIGLNTTNILSVAGSITLADFAFANLLGWDASLADIGTYTLIDGGTGVTLSGTTPSAANPFDFGNGRQAYFQQGSLQVVVVPEPSAAVLGSIGLALLLQRCRHASCPGRAYDRLW